MVLNGLNLGLNLDMLRYDECTHSLREIYEDKDGGRKEEVEHNVVRK